MRHVVGKTYRGTTRTFAPVLQDTREVLVTVASIVGRPFAGVRPVLSTAMSLAARALWALVMGGAFMGLLVCVQTTAQEMHGRVVLSTATMALDAKGAALLGLLVIVARVAYEAVLTASDRLLRLVDLLGELKRGHREPHSTTKRECVEVFSEYLQISVMDTIRTVIVKLQAEEEEVRLGLIVRRLRELRAAGAERRALQTVASVLDSLYDCPAGNLFDMEVSEGADPRQLIACVLGLN
jgi:hypothetical protein